MTSMLAARPLLLSFALALAGCAGTVSSYGPSRLTDRAPSAPVSKPAVADSDLDSPPLLSRAPRSEPAPSELYLSNGVRVLFVERHSLPLVSISFLLRFDPSEAVTPIPTLFARALKSSAQRSSGSPYPFLSAAGVSTSTWCSDDVLSLEATMLAPHAKTVVSHLGTTVAAPAFRDRDLDLGRRDLRAERTWLRQYPNALAAVQRMLLGETHPARMRTFDVESIQATSLEALANFGNGHLSAENLTIALVGDFSRSEMVSILEARLGSLPRTAPHRASKLAPWREPAPPTSARLAIVPWRGAAQSKISFAFAGPPPQSEDRAALLLLSERLSASSGRLMHKLREEEGATYGVGAMTGWWRTGSAFMIGTAVEGSHTVATVATIAEEIARLSAELIPEDELARARERATTRAKSSGGSPYGKDLGRIETIATESLPLDAFARLASQLDALTAEDVRRVATKYLRADTMQIAVAADPAIVEVPLRALGIADVSIAPPP